MAITKSDRFGAGNDADGWTFALLTYRASVREIEVSLRS